MNEVTTGTFIMRAALSRIALTGCEEDSAIAERGLAGHVDPIPSRIGRVVEAILWTVAGVLVGRLL